MFVEVTLIDTKNTVFVNSRHIVGIIKLDAHTQLSMSDGTTLVIVESPAALAHAINHPTFK
jgi:hypothetical protein